MEFPPKKRQCPEEDQKAFLRTSPTSNLPSPLELSSVKEPFQKESKKISRELLEGSMTASTSDVVKIASHLEIHEVGMTVNDPANLQNSPRDPFPELACLDISDSQCFVFTPLGLKLGYLDSRIAKIIHIMKSKLPLVRFDAIVPSDGNGRLVSRKRLDKSRAKTTLSCNINVYGGEVISQVVGNFLTRNKIHLQEPCDFLGNIEYRNPQIWIPPGMKIASMSWDSIKTKEDALMVRKTPDNLLELFENGKNSKLLQEMEPSSSVLTSLFSENKYKNSDLVKIASGHGIGERGFLICGSFLLALEYEETQQQKPDIGGGGLLADAMGLGKTLSVLSLIASTVSAAFEWATYTSSQISTKIISKGTLIIAPLSKQQISRHIKHGALKIHKYHGPGRSIDPIKLSYFDVVLTTYQTVAQEYKSFCLVKGSKGVIEQLSWYRIVLDEAHYIRNRSTWQCKAICSLDAQDRWGLTGTPIQNKLYDLGGLLQFLRMRPFDNMDKFKQHILSDWVTGDLKGVAKIRMLLDFFSLQRSNKAITLPERIDRDHYLDFSNEERQMYDDTIANSKADMDSMDNPNFPNILQWILMLRCICNLGKLGLKPLDPCLIPSSMGISGYDFTMTGMIGHPKCCICYDEISTDIVTAFFRTCSHNVCELCFPPNLEHNGRRVINTNFELCCFACEVISTVEIIKANEESYTFKTEFTNADTPVDQSVFSIHEPSTKVKALIEALQMNLFDENDDPVKSVVFSEWTSTLDYVKRCLDAKGIQSVRFDGALTVKKRDESLRRFRDKYGPNVILISIGAGGVGLDLTVASRVYLLEPQWNPMIDAQAFDRVIRIGQTKKVTTTRYIIKNTYEEVCNFSTCMPL
ncbi:hypothetical protein RUND412_010190 [Rhizina undulata]